MAEQQPKKTLFDELVGEEGIKMKIGLEVMDFVLVGITFFSAMTLAIVVAAAINRRLED